MTDKMNGTKPPKMEERLYQNRYMVDEGRPHVRIEHQRGGDSPELRALVNICPAGCYRLNEEGRVEVAPDGCMECGTCRIVCQATGELEWSYPRGGYGILFKFG
ncbi:ferredoxin family protein [Rhodovulum steppense]|uniref:Ferredoxin-like protein n=1 Tax=Rhodovulum steppense TaxID=540251 RepID=A0A4R1YWR5_9RHOB|nr:ferredoxin family protein [Rhodovulum steppense]TCM85213.1 ferredoxin like protein [Rhodovulum steppense]